MPKLVYTYNELPHVSANYVVIIRDIIYKGIFVLYP
jgi:hypothetical protein